MIGAIVNKEEGTFLQMHGISSFGIKEIIVDENGAKAFALVCYPGPGAGYVVARFNEAKDAHLEFEKLLNEATSKSQVKVYEVMSNFIPPLKEEAEKIAEVVDLASVRETNDND